MQAIRSIWGRAVIERKLSAFEKFCATARLKIDSLKRTITEIQDQNERYAKQILALEGENRDLKQAVESYAAATRRIDPNAKCPSCGAMKGHLQTVVKRSGETFQVRPMNHCDECGFTFVSGPPVAGEELANQLYQAPQELLDGR